MSTHSWIKVSDEREELHGPEDILVVVEREEDIDLWSIVKSPVVQWRTKDIDEARELAVAMVERRTTLGTVEPKAYTFTPEFVAVMDQERWRKAAKVWQEVRGAATFASLDPTYATKPYVRRIVAEWESFMFGTLYHVLCEHGLMVFDAPAQRIGGTMGCFLSAAPWLGDGQWVLDRTSGITHDEVMGAFEGRQDLKLPSKDEVMAIANTMMFDAHVAGVLSTIAKMRSA